MSSVPSGGNTWKNIAIGVFTTVAAYAIINFVGIGKKDTTKKNKKEATEKAWLSANQYLNYANEKFKTIACFSCDEQAMKKELMRELDIYSNSLNNIKNDKDVDDKMLSAIDRIIQQFTDMKPLYEQYFDSILILKTFDLEKRIELSQPMQMRFIQNLAAIQSKDTSEIVSYLNDVNKRHHSSLKLEMTKLEYDSTALVGKWKIECAADLAFNKDSTINWKEGENEFKGKWSLIDKKLHINLDNGQVFDFILIQLSHKMLIYLNTENNSLLSGCYQKE